MGHMKNLDIRIRMGGDDAVAAACEMADLVDERRCYQNMMDSKGDQEPVAWAVMLSPETLHDRYTFEWEASAISRALWDQQQISSQVVPLAPPNRLSLTDEEREAIELAIEALQQEGGFSKPQHALHKLLERTA